MFLRNQVFPECNWRYYLEFETPPEGGNSMSEPPSDSIDGYITYMNSEYGVQHYEGFVGCFVHTSKPLIVGYRFDSAKHARHFQMLREKEGPTYRMEKDYMNGEIVLEYRLV
jgi:hypothetical protein